MDRRLGFLVGVGPFDLDFGRAAEERRQKNSDKAANAVVNARVHQRSRFSLLMNAATAAASSGLKIRSVRMVSL